MTIRTIPYSKTGYFSKLMCDYVAENATLDYFYGRFPKLENFKGQLEEKQLLFNYDSRKTLVRALEKQYGNTNTSEATGNNISSLSEANTFTITTGHQLNLFTGPLYFLYKIFSVINLSEKLKETYPDSNFVPIYWMATEDHDFDEINYFNLFGKKTEWKRESGGAVGALSTEGLSEVLKDLKIQLGESDNAIKLTALFSEAYTNHENLADATRYLGNKLFSDYGLVIVDGNDKALKEEFAPYVKQELLEGNSYSEITATSNRLTDLGYPQQVFPREINLFYLADGIRERIIEKEGQFYVNDTSIKFSRDEILVELEKNPHNFSPNALLRPLYQEIILPNLCYVGGGGELAYWFQLKDYFESVGIPFPILLLRNSVLLMNEKDSEKLEKLDVTLDSLFLPKHELEAKYTLQLSKVNIDFTKQKAHLIEQFKALHNLAKETDTSFEGAVAAQEKKQINGLAHLEKRLLTAQKRKHSDQLKRLTAIQTILFPKQSLQERLVNFSEFYLEFGDELLLELKQNLDPLANEFTVLEL
ncbi:MAG: bacillithiol biosynthesis cysteine-adding enzyme BshC [Ulvibacter sp.]|jgi:bacillithiol biosynthesis cysteine-adding enzyme BshC